MFVLRDSAVGVLPAPVPLLGIDSVPIVLSSLYSREVEDVVRSVGDLRRYVGIFN